MTLTVVINGAEIPIGTDKIIIKGKKRYLTSRLLYFTLKTFSQMPRLYGVADSDPVKAWKRNFEQKYASILSSHLDPGKIRLKGEFTLLAKRFAISGKIDGNGLKVTVDLLEKPSNVSTGLRGMVEVDSFYFTGIERPKPSLIPGSKDGFLGGFHRFLVLQTESASGIPKTLGIISEYINSIVLPQGFSTNVLGRVVTIDEKEGLFLDGEPLYNVDPEMLSLIGLKLSLDMAPENGVVVLEDPEAHLSDENKDVVKEWIDKYKGTMVIVTCDNIFSNGKVIEA
ncbi:hypothetical protein GWK48_08700 [Metallosphaera tengchongensis]|uniref:Uncharacterized protein n=1 Tax=Metallosphaera tengchongensis TaxID=1532350 RepID=A0A6N0NZD3_9CREN|nr:hypothetical protein [Metallosphaera tengchongensis]QKR00440.1 hypothetical protein GWK48_08700 [Metallosphaera tengchongensis]